MHQEFDFVDDDAMCFGAPKLRMSRMIKMIMNDTIIMYQVPLVLSTWAGVAVGFSARYRAATPATWGTAMDVPDAQAYAVSFSVSQRSASATAYCQLKWPPEAIISKPVQAAIQRDDQQVSCCWHICEIG